MSEPSRSTRSRFDGDRATRAAFPDSDDEMLPISGGGAVVWPIVVAVTCGLGACLSMLIGWNGAAMAMAICTIAAVGVLIGGDA